MWEVFKICNFFIVDINILINMLNYVINVFSKLMKNLKYIFIFIKMELYEKK